jgi:hypothetical protein
MRNNEKEKVTWRCETEEPLKPPAMADTTRERWIER